MSDEGVPPAPVLTPVSDEELASLLATPGISVHDALTYPYWRRVHALPDGRGLIEYTRWVRAAELVSSIHVFEAREAWGATAEGAAHRWEHFDWARAVGALSVDQNLHSLVVDADIDAVGRAIVEIGGQWNTDVLGQSLRLEARGALLFALRGRSFCHVLSSLRLFPEGDLLSQLSEVLACDVFSYMESDTAGLLAHALFRCGDVVERFGECEDEVVERWSSVRDLSNDPRVPRSDGLLRALGLLEPGLNPHHFFEGSGSTVVSPRLVLHAGRRDAVNEPPLRRVDHVVFPAAASAE